LRLGRTGDRDPRELGRIAEDAAARYLQSHGYAILDRNYATAQGELDIVARHGAEMVFVEVKSRTSADIATPADAVTAAKQSRLLRLARAYLAAKVKTEMPCRFDVVEVLISPEGRVLEITIDRAAFSERSAQGGHK
jgi:putative endonuclease